MSKTTTHNKKVAFKTKLGSFDITVTFERTDFETSKKSIVSIYQRSKGKDAKGKDIDSASTVANIPLEEFREKIKKIL